MEENVFREMLAKVTNFTANPYHQFVWINGEPDIGEGVSIGGFSEINAKGAKLIIGDNCDIASFVSINCADSHKRCIELSSEIERANITLGHNVFVGSHSFIKGGAHIGHHSVVAAGTIVEAGNVPPYSLVVGNPMQVKPGYYSGL